MKLIHAILITTIALTGCKKEQPNIIPERGVATSALYPDANYPPVPERYVNGYCSLYNFSTLASQDNFNRDAVFSGELRNGYNATCIGMNASSTPDNDGNIQAVLEEKKCGSASVNKDFFDIYGTDIVFTANAKAFGEVFRMKMYMPEKIRVTSHTYSQGLSISPGEKLTWNKDTRNPSHDVITITYDPDDFLNADFLASGYKARVVKKYIVHNSIGSYTFQASDFAGVPSGAHIDVDIDRMNVAQRYTESHKVYQFSLGSRLSISFILKQ